MSGSYKIIWIGNIELEYHPDLQLSEAEIECDVQIGNYWKEFLEVNPSAFNGKVLNMMDHSIKDDHLLIRSAFIEYKTFYASRHIPSLKKQVKPLGVSGLVILKDDKEEFIMLGKRSDSVTQYPGWLELVPSGGIDDAFICEQKVDIRNSLLKELEEEANIPIESVSDIKTFAFVLDENEQTYDICCIISLENKNDIMSRLKNNNEYSSYMFVPIAEIGSLDKMNDLIPTSKAILSAFVQNKTASVNTL